MRNIAVLCCVCVLSLLLPNVSCAAFEYEIGGRGLKLMPTAENWFNALLTCRKIGMELPMIVNSDQDGQLRELMRSNKLDAIWLGATDIATEGSWKWIETGAVVDYTNWATHWNGRPIHNPDNWNVEHCLEINLKHTRNDMTWNDAPYNHVRRFFCMEAISKIEQEKEKKLMSDSKELQAFKAGVSQLSSLISSLQQMMEMAEEE